MQAEDDFAFGRPLLGVVDPKPPALCVGDLGVVRCEGIARQLLEAFVGRAKNLHGNLRVEWRYLISSSSTSNDSAAFPGITGGAPRSP